MKSESWLAILGTVLCFGLDSMKVNLHISLQTGVLEGQNARVRGQLVSLSEQQLVDCDSTNYGCNGGWPSNALAYIQRNGGTCACINISFTWQSYLPKHNMQTCTFRNSGHLFYIHWQSEKQDHFRSYFLWEKVQTIQDTTMSYYNWMKRTKNHFILI